VSAGERFRYDLVADSGVLEMAAADEDEFDGAVPGTRTAVTELPPAAIAAIQDTAVRAGRPEMRCTGNPYNNYGTIVAVLFSKPMDAEGAARGAGGACV
jgi:hypothetical protein